MAVEVQCPSCRAILRPTPAMLAQGGERPCPKCATLLHFDPTQFTSSPIPPPLPSRRPRRQARGNASIIRQIPVWVWPVAAFLIVFLFGGTAMLGFLLLKPAGITVFGRPKITQADFAKIKPGMTPVQVRAILGQPTEESQNSAGKAMFAGITNDKRVLSLPDLRMMMWTDERTYTAIVYFVDDQLLGSVWQNGPPNRDRYR